MNRSIKYIVANVFLLTTICYSNAQSLIKSKKVDKVLEKGVSDKSWDKAEQTTVPLMPQNIIPPTVKSGSVKEMKVKSIYDANKIAFLIEWTDSSRDASVDVDKFCDQVAIQIPVDPSTYPSFMMGNMNGRVHIIHWKAVWQDDIEKGFQDVKSAHPNLWVDLYHFSDSSAKDIVNARDVTINQLSSKEAKNYMHGHYAGNPMSLFDRKNPSEEAIAEGYGTLTTQQEQNASAWAIWENNTWKVLIIRPISSIDKSDAIIKEKGMIAFAVWDGSARNIGAKKNYSMWVNFEMIK